jgi:hypothetical protein
LLGKCTPSVVGLTIETANPAGNLEASGTLNERETTVPVDINGETTMTEVMGAKQVDFDVVVPDSTVGTFERVDAHVVAGSACPFRGMITPSS